MTYRIYKNDKQFINFFLRLINIRFPIKMINKKINVSYNKDLQYISNILDKETNNFERKRILKYKVLKNCEKLNLN